MSITSTMVQTEVKKKQIVTSYKDLEYGPFLKLFGISYKTNGRWLEVGCPNEINNWNITITVKVNQIEALLNTILPILKEMKVRFQVVKNSYFHYQVNGGFFGSPEIGRVVILWPDDASQAISLIKRLLPLTGSFVGPSVMENCVRFGQIIFLGGISNKRSALLNQVPNDLKRNLIFQQYPVKRRLIGPYIPVNMLKYSPKGNVYKGHSLRRLSFAACLIKEGRAHMAEDYLGRDVRDRLLSEKKALEHWNKFISKYNDGCHYAEA